MVDNTFIKTIDDACDKALCALGAKRPRRGSRFFELSEDVLCWIGLNQGRHDDFVRINPNVGVHVVPLMKLESEFDGEKYKKGRFATLSVHLGELCPDVDVFEFYEGSDIEAEANRLAQSIVEYGLPYAKQYLSMKSILPVLKSQIPSLGGYPERYAIALHLSGKDDEARQFIEERKTYYRANESENVQNRFNQFSDLFLNKLEPH